MSSELNVKVAKMETDIEYIKKSVDEIKTFHANFEKVADSKYASKTTERVVYGLVGLILVTVFLLILNKAIGA